MSVEKIRRPVRRLSDDVARKIAAGEVIDRPAAIARELLDNAVDSGADSISLEIDGGGIEKIRVMDNGHGMTKEDLQNSARPHCTSKIIGSEDLLNLTTLGFRGEALASIAAVSRLTISSGTYRMRASVTEAHSIEQIPPVQDGKGTVVMSEGLFENFPARRHFLKRPASESMMCREIFIEKSLPRPDIAFRLIVDGELRRDLPACGSLAQRFARALDFKESPDLFSEIKSSGTEPDGVSKWSFSLVLGDLSIWRSDRKQIYIFVNGRRVQEFSLIQAIEYGCQGFFPNGTHPVAALFLQVDPHLVDFNIHPAKKEVRFKDISSVHHGVSLSVRNHLRSNGIKSDFETDSESHKETSPGGQSSLFNAIIENELRREEKNEAQPHRKSSYFVADRPAPATNFHDGRDEEAHLNVEHTSRLAEFALRNDGDEDFVYYGTIFGTFLMARKNDVFYLIDQHAAHERILFNRLMAGGGGRQELLVPYEIKTDSKDEDAYLSRIQDALSGAGFKCESHGGGKWIFTSVPASYTGSQEDLRQAIFEKQVSPEEIIYHIAATAACKAAVKDGTILGPVSAEKLAREALMLKDPRCPHGRPVWTSLTKEELFARVRRTR